MNGHVERRYILLSVPLRLPDGRTNAIECVVDTGFQGALALPPAAIHALGLPFRDTIAANLANNTDVDIDVYKAVIVWNGQERAVDVLATGRRPLLDTMLLDGFHMGVDFIEGGQVTLNLLPVSNNVS